MLPRFRALAATAVAAVTAALIALPAAPVAAQATPAADGLWTPAPAVDVADLTVVPAEYHPFELDLGGMTDLLGASVTTSARSLRAVVPERTLTVPAPDGQLVAFRVTPVTVLDGDSAARHPEIRTFVGRGVDDSALTIRADLTPLGFHAMVRSGDNSTRAWYVDPAVVGRTDTYLAYPGGSLPTPRLGEGEDAERTDPVDGGGASSAPLEAARAGTVGTRTIRLALANDPSFAQFYGEGNVLAAKATITNRVAGVFNDDLGVRLVLAEGTDRLDFATDAAAFEPGGACADSACYTRDALERCKSATLAQNARVVPQILGDDAFDVGHILLGRTGGGVAYRGSAGIDDTKGGGCTGSPNPTGDAFAIDYVAHEVGHQLGGNHTYNACSGGSGSTGVEPGSGSTIMAYAGICGENNVQPHGDPYFSQTTIAEIHRTIDDRFVPVDSGNAVPTVTAPPSRTLPLRTPFTLTAQASDAEGPVTFLWEQNDVGDSDRQLFDDGKTGGPLFRVFGTYVDTRDQARQYFSAGRHQADGDLSRTFPDLAQILAGNTNAVTGTCDPSLSGVAKIECFSEFLPTAAYADHLDFRVTVRDADPRGGGVAAADVRLPLDRSAGPLLVNGMDATDAGFLGGSRHTVRWAVNGTDAESLAPRVRVRLSTDGGLTFPTVLADSTPNDGAETVTLPNVDAARARLKVEAVDNYFFAIDAAPFRLSARDAAATVTPSRSEVEPGGSVTLTGAGFLANESISLTLAGVTVTVQADADGAFRVERVVPAGSAPGTAAVEAAGQSSGLVAAASIAVTAAPSPTPTPVPTATPAPSATPTVTATPAPSATPTVTATPASSAAPTSSATPASAATPAAVAPSAAVDATAGRAPAGLAATGGDVTPGVVIAAAVAALIAGLSLYARRRRPLRRR